MIDDGWVLWNDVMVVGGNVNGLFLGRTRRRSERGACDVGDVG